MSATRLFYSFHVRFFYFMSCFIDRVSLKCPTLCSPKLGFHNMLLSSASVPDSHNRNVGVAEMETPKLWGNVLDPHFFISFKPLRNINIKYLYSIIFNIRALICLISCLFAYQMKLVSIVIDVNKGVNLFTLFVFPSIFDSKRLL